MKRIAEEVVAELPDTPVDNVADVEPEAGPPPWRDKLALMKIHLEEGQEAVDRAIREDRAAARAWDAAHPRDPLAVPPLDSTSGASRDSPQFALPGGWR